MTDIVPEGTFCLVSLLAIRIGAALRIVPFFGGKPMPLIPWISLSVLLAFVVAPWSGNAPSTEFGSLLWFALAAKELFIGVFLGILARFAFSVLELAGSFIGVSLLYSVRGGDPSESSVSVAYVLLASALFLVLDGHHALMTGLVGTVKCLPPDQLIGVSGQLIDQYGPALKLFASAIGAAVFVSIPVFASGILADIIYGMVSRIAQGSTSGIGSVTVRSVFVLLAAVATLGFVASTAIDFLQTTIADLNICPA